MKLLELFYLYNLKKKEPNGLTAWLLRTSLRQKLKDTFLILCAFDDAYVGGHGLITLLLLLPLWMKFTIMFFEFLEWTLNDETGNFLLKLAFALFVFPLVFTAVVDDQPEVGSILQDPQYGMFRDAVVFSQFAWPGSIRGAP